MKAKKKAKKYSQLQHNLALSMMMQIGYLTGRQMRMLRMIIKKSKSEIKLLISFYSTMTKDLQTCLYVLV